MTTNVSNNSNNTTATSSSSVSTSAIQVPNSAAQKISLIRDRVLQVIQNSMPIEALFTPELKIDLGLFVKDQMLLYKIAELIDPLSKADSVDIGVIEKVFQDADLLAEIKTMFKDISLYMTLLYEACLDVLKQKSHPSLFKSAIEGRIYTLKNALLAQHSPDAVQKNQLQNKISSQPLDNIKNEGAHFIRESISLYLQILQTPKDRPFQEILTSVAKQLIPFVKSITRMYLREYDKVCPDNPLTFRNRTGYNHHGLVAATVMEACLNSLGFATRHLNRTDLEPKVTLATAHSVIEVSGPDSRKYLVDPTYIQFHKDVYLDDAHLPTSPVLVLEETEIDSYIEKQIMTPWISNFQLCSSSDQRTIKKLKENDQILPFTIKTANLPHELIPKDPEDWVRKAFKKVWGFSGYSAVRSDQGFESIFYGTGTNRKTFEYIKSMNLPSLTNHLSFAEVESQLNRLTGDASHRKNSLEDLSLFAQLPELKRGKYLSLFDLDPRVEKNANVDVVLNAYFHSLRKIVNPEGKDLKVIYGCSGADCMSVLLATDAKELTLVDLTKTSLDEFNTALSQVKDRATELATYLEDSSDSFISTRKDFMGSQSGYYGNGVHYMKHLPLKMFMNLKDIGVNLSKVTLKAVENGIQIDFSWKHHGATDARKRSITYLMADIAKPQIYPSLLQKRLTEGFDIFYMKGAFLVPRNYPQFLPNLADSLNPGGWLMTTDKTFYMEEVDPAPCLQERHHQFVLQQNDEKKILEELMVLPFDPFFRAYSLEKISAAERFRRAIGSDFTYWAQLNLRQKI